MKRGAIASLVVLLLIVVVLGGAVWLTRRLEQTAGPVPSRTPSAASTSSTATAKPPSPIPGVPKRPKDAQPMTVTYVYDGDTLQLKASKPGAYVSSINPVKVRLIGVNAPEMTPKKQCYAQQATDRLRALAPTGSRVWVKPDRDSWDDYKRRLFLVWTDRGVLIDHDLVAGGYGPAIRVYPNITYWPLFEKTQAAAQKAKKGLWGRC